MKFGKRFKLNNPRISILVDGDMAAIEVVDRDAAVTFLDIEMTTKDFCAALGRLAEVPCVAEVCGLDLVGMQHECKRFEFEFKDKGDWKTRDKRAHAAAIKVCPEGWVPDAYFGSQGSFFTKDGKEYAATIIRRWVPAENK